MLTGSADTDGIMISYLDISTLSYNIKLINKYYCDLVSLHQETLHTNLFPVTKSLLETEGFLESQFDNITYISLNSDSQSDKIMSKWTALRLCVIYRMDVETVKKIIDDNKLIGNCAEGQTIFDNLCNYCEPKDLEWMKERRFEGSTNSYINSIKNNRNINVQWLLDNNIVFSMSKCIAKCIKYNNIEILKILLDKYIRYMEYDFMTRLYNNWQIKTEEHNLEFKGKIYMKIGEHFKKKIIGSAIYYCNMEALDLLLENEFELDHETAYNYISKSGNMELIQRLQTKYGLIFSKNVVHQATPCKALLYAAERGDKNMIEILLEAGYAKDHRTCSYGALHCSEKNDTEFLKWLVDKGFKKRITSHFVRKNKNNICIMNWLKNNEFQMSRDVFSEALEHSDKDTIEWIYTNILASRRFNSNTTNALIKRENPNLDLLLWMDTKNISYNKKTLLIGLIHNNINKYRKRNIVEIIEWLTEELKGDRGSDVYNYAEHTGNTRLINTLNKYGVEKLEI